MALNDTAGFNSQNWFPAIKRIAGDYYGRFDKNLVSYNENMIEAVKKAYPGRLSAIKGEIYGPGDAEENFIGNRIDRHKIIALYIQLFLEKPAFAIKDNTGGQFPSAQVMLVNEIFCLNIMRSILTDWNGKAFDAEKFKPYANPFLKLLHYYKKRCDFHRNFSFSTHALAHLIYFIERDFFV